jgi:uracil-DNA glycosylase family 4
MGLDSSQEARLACLQLSMARCRICEEAGYIVRAAPVFAGRAGDKVFVIGQAPGRLSAEQDTPFAGPGGRRLDTWLTRAGFPPNFLRTSTYLTSLTKCDPGRRANGTGDRQPSRAELELCLPYLARELEIVRPEVVLLVGQMAIRTYLDRNRLEDLVGKTFDRDGITWVPLPHPSGASRWLNETANQALVDRAIETLGHVRLRRTITDGPVG